MSKCEALEQHLVNKMLPEQPNYYCNGFISEGELEAKAAKLDAELIKKITERKRKKLEEMKNELRTRT